MKFCSDLQDFEGFGAENAVFVPVEGYRVVLDNFKCLNRDRDQKTHTLDDFGVSPVHTFFFSMF